MSETPHTETTPAAHDPAATAKTSDESQMALVIYILFLAGFVTGGITTIVGLIMAYIYKDSAPEWLKTHYVNAIHTFWKGLLYMVVSLVLTLIIIGALLMLVQMIWFIVRCAKGIQGVTNKTAYPNPTSWGF